MATKWTPESVKAQHYQLLGMIEMSDPNHPAVPPIRALANVMEVLIKWEEDHRFMIFRDEAIEDILEALEKGMTVEFED